jgi:hypothetical protein
MFGLTTKRRWGRRGIYTALSGRGIYFGMIGREGTLDARNTRQARAGKDEATL